MIMAETDWKKAFEEGEEIVLAIVQKREFPEQSL